MKRWMLENPLLTFGLALFALASVVVIVEDFKACSKATASHETGARRVAGSALLFADDLDAGVRCYGWEYETHSFSCVKIR